MTFTMYIGVEFTEESGGGLALVHNEWITPRKSEVWWPPYKQQSAFNKALHKGESPEEKSWTLYSIHRIFFDEDDYESARKKLKLCESTSEVPTDLEHDYIIRSQRKRQPVRKLQDSDDSDTDHGCTVRKIPRPPRLSNKDLVPFKENVERSIAVGNSSLLPNVSYNNESLASPSRRLEKSFRLAADVHSTPTCENTQNRAENLEKFTIEGASKEQFWKLLVEIREQNKQILARVKKSDFNNAILMAPLPDNNIPVTFPLDEADNVRVLDAYLAEDTNNSAALSSYFSTFGGKDITTKTNKILKHVLTNRLATEFSFHGTRANKKSFANLALKATVIDAVRRTTNNATNNEIEAAIKVWLKHAPKRLKQEKSNRDI